MIMNMSNNGSGGLEKAQVGMTTTSSRYGQSVYYTDENGDVKTAYIPSVDETPVILTISVPGCIYIPSSKSNEDPYVRSYDNTKYQYFEQDSSMGGGLICFVKKFE